MSDEDDTTIRLALICVQNAERSQMAATFAERERATRDLKGSVDILSGGTHPADHVYEEVVEVMDEEGLDLSDRTPHEITTEDLLSCDYVATIGCSTLDVSEAESDADIHDWVLDDPDGQDLDRVREIRGDVKERVRALFDEISASDSAAKVDIMSDE